MKTIQRISCAVGIIIAIGLTGCTESDEDGSVNTGIPGTTTVVTYSPELVTNYTANIKGSVTMEIRGRISETGIILWSPGLAAYDSIGFPENVIALPGGITEKILSSSVSEGNFYVFLETLVPNTTYRYRAFATNDAGTFYGKENILVTSSGTVTDSEGNTYQTIKIGEQEWMRENLRSMVYADNSCINGCYQLKSDPEYGKRYTWMGANHAAVPRIASQGGACPVGWHIPSDIEWQTLLINVGISADQFRDNLKSIDLIGYDQAQALKEQGKGYWANPGISNSTGFSVIPAAVCSDNGAPSCVTTAFWTSTPDIFYGFQSESEKIVRGYSPSQECGFSVRCVKDIK